MKFMNNLIDERILVMVDISKQFNYISKNCRFGISKRQTIFLAYFDMNLEYTNSIHLLIKNKHFGVSSALVRLHLESLFRALWSLRCATDEDISKINEGKFIFSNTKKIVSEIDSKWGDNNAYKDIHAKYWSDMCDYTHTGNLQLSKRFTKGELKTNYSNEMILGILEGTEFIVQEFILHLFDGHNCMDELNIMLEHFLTISDNIN